MTSQIITFNLRGKCFKIDKSIFTKRSNFKINQMLGSEHSEVLVDRNPKLFNFILDFFSNGEMHYPRNICVGMLEDELKYWGLTDDVLASCCWHRYKSELDSKKTLEFVSECWKEKIDIPSSQEKQSCYKHLSTFVNKPNSSKGAKIWSIMILFLICLSIILFMLESLIPMKVFLNQKYQAEFRNLTEYRLIFLLKNTKPHDAFSVMESLITIILTLDFILKFITADSKCKFWIKVHNIIDFLGVAPLWVLLVLSIIRLNYYMEDNEAFKDAFFAMNVFRGLRIYRLVHFMKHYRTLHLIYLAMKSSAKELLLLIVLMCIFATTFATMMYFAEIANDNFMSIPQCLWWAFITMTTVGYGDFYPKGVYGYIIGVMCSMMGILVIALPVPVIVNNFSSYYDAAKMVLREEQCKRLNTTGKNASKYKTMESGNKVAPSADLNLNPISQSTFTHYSNTVSNTDHKLVDRNMDSNIRNYSSNYELNLNEPKPVYNNQLSNGTEVSYSVNV